MGQEPCGRLSFLKEPKSSKGLPQTAICNLNITLPNHKKVGASCLNSSSFQVISYHLHVNEFERQKDRKQCCPDIKKEPLNFIWFRNDCLLLVSFITVSKACASPETPQRKHTATHAYPASFYCLAHCGYI